MHPNKYPLSPQQAIQQQQLFDGAYRSEKIQKSRNSLLMDEDQSTTLVKTHKHPFNINDISIHQNKCSLNNTRLNVGDTSQRHNLLNGEDSSSPLPSRICTYCKRSQDDILIQICSCSVAHQKCANSDLQTRALANTIKCKNCKEYKQIFGVVTFDFSKWRSSFWSLILELTAIIVLLLTLAFMTYMVTMQYEDTLSSDRLMISVLVFSYTIGFILMVCLLTKMAGHFKKIEFRIKRYDLKNVEFNKQYVELLLRG